MISIRPLTHHNLLIIHPEKCFSGYFYANFDMRSANFAIARFEEDFLYIIGMRGDRDALPD